MSYVGTLGLASPALSISDDSTSLETVALMEVQTQSYSCPYCDYTYPSSYLVYSGTLLFPQGSLPLPLVSGAQTYGLAMFHSSDDKHVMVVQTGTSQPGSAAAVYYALLR